MKSKTILFYLAIVSISFPLCLIETGAAYSQRRNIPSSNQKRNNEIVITGGGYAFKPLQGWKVSIGEEESVLNLASNNQDQFTAIMIKVERFNKLRALSADAKISSELLFDELYKSISSQTALSQKREIQVGNKTGYLGIFKHSDFLQIRELTSDRTNAVLISGQLAVSIIDKDRFIVVTGITSSSTWLYDKQFAAVLSSIHFVSPTS